MAAAKRDEGEVMSLRVILGGASMEISGKMSAMGLRIGGGEGLAMCRD